MIYDSNVGSDLQRSTLKLGPQGITVRSCNVRCFGIGVVPSKVTLLFGAHEKLLALTDVQPPSCAACQSSRVVGPGACGKLFSLCYFSGDC